MKDAPDAIELPPIVGRVDYEGVRFGYGEAEILHGIDLHVNWPGRAAVWPVMSAIFFALVGLETLAEVLLYIGIVLSIWATALYVRQRS